VSLLGSLEQFDLSIVLKRIEAYGKTGLLIIKQDQYVVEFSFRQGQLMCIGPVRQGLSLGERLLQAGVISQQAFNEIVSLLGSDYLSETRTALTLIDLDHVNQQSLYAWAFQEARRVLSIVLTWQSGEMYFSENSQPPADRLLIALSVTSLLEQLASPSQPVRKTPPPPQNRQPVEAIPSRIADAPTLHGSEPLFEETTAIATCAPASQGIELSSLFFAEPPVSEMERHTDSLTPSSSLTPPRQATAPMPPMRVDISYMQPQMVLMPTDLSGYREQNPLIQLSPEQWQLFTRADGQTTLAMAKQVLGMSPEQVCQLAGELQALGLIRVTMPGAPPVVSELSPVSRDYLTAGLSNGYVPPGSAAAPVQPWSAAMPAPDFSRQVVRHFETQSQWGNGGNGAKFELGHGWVVVPESGPQAAPVESHYNSARLYAKAG